MRRGLLVLWVIFTHLVRSSDRPSTLGNKPERASRAQGPRHDGDAFGARQVIGPVFSPKPMYSVVIHHLCYGSHVLWQYVTGRQEIYLPSNSSPSSAELHRYRFRVSERNERDNRITSM